MPDTRTTIPVFVVPGDLHLIGDNIYQGPDGMTRFMLDNEHYPGDLIFLRAILSHFGCRITDQIDIAGEAGGIELQTDLPYEKYLEITQ